MIIYNKKYQFAPTPEGALANGLLFVLDPQQG